MSGADLLAQWLAEDEDGFWKTASFMPIRVYGWSCSLRKNNESIGGKEFLFEGLGPTPDAAMRAAVEKARRG